MAPGAGLLAMPPPPGFVAIPDAMQVWHTAMTPFPGESLLDAAHALGMTTAALGDVDLSHVGSSRHAPLILVGPPVRTGVVTGQPASPADLPATLLYALGAPTTTDLALGTWATGAAVGGVPQPTPNAATEGHALLRAFATTGP